MPAAQLPEDNTPPHFQFTPTPAPARSASPWAGALPVGGRTWRVHTLVAATGIEAHLARPTLDAILLTLVDICEGEVGEEERMKRSSKGERLEAGTREGMAGAGAGVASKWERNAFGGWRWAAPLPLSPASLAHDGPASRPLAPRAWWWAPRRPLSLELGWRAWER